ncbi:MAG: hypothetical protein K0R17_1578 [Rariglobus sp.]|nr:hypothetical protein [Rariglobus sp.]
MVLDPVTARLVESINLRQVSLDRRLVEHAQSHVTGNSLIDSHTGGVMSQRDAREHRVGAAAQPSQHRPGLDAVLRFVERMTVDEHRRVRSEHPCVRVAFGHPVGLQRGVVRNHHARIRRRLLVFGHLRRHHIERHPQPREQFTAARRGGGKDERRLGHAACLLTRNVRSKRAL